MNRIREARKRRGLTMKKLGELVGASEASISQYETGKHEPDNETIVKIADALCVTVDYLLGRDDIPESDDLFELREQIRRNPDLGDLFSAATMANPEHVRAAAAMLKALKESSEP